MNTCDIDEAKHQAMSLFNNLIKEPKNWVDDYQNSFLVGSYRSGYKHNEIAFVLTKTSLTLHGITIDKAVYPIEPYGTDGKELVKQKAEYKKAKAAYDKTTIGKAYKAIEDHYKAAADEAQCKALLKALIEPKHKVEPNPWLTYDPLKDPAYIAKIQCVESDGAGWWVALWLAIGGIAGLALWLTCR